MKERPKNGVGQRYTKGTKDLPWSEKTRARIQTTKILKRLECHILGLVDPAEKALNPDAEPVKMSPSQVNAAIGLLKKSMPDLSAQDINIKGDWQTSVTELIEKLDELEHKGKQDQGVSLH